MNIALLGGFSQMPMQGLCLTLSLCLGVNINFINFSQGINKSGFPLALEKQGKPGKMRQLFPVREVSQEKVRENCGS